MKRITVIMCTILMILIGCSSKTETEKTQFFKEISNEEFVMKAAIEIVYQSNGEILSISTDEIYTSNDELFLNDFKARFRTRQSAMSQIQGAEIKVDFLDNTAKYFENIPVDGVDIEELKNADDIYSYFIKDDKLDLETIKEYLNAQGFEERRVDE